MQRHKLLDNVGPNCHFIHMRDDRYRGTSLPKPVRKLCQMAKREADRARPDLLRRQAVAALEFDADREISAEFRGRLQEHDAEPGLFMANDLAAAARTVLETDIVRNLDAGRGADLKAAVTGALRQRGEGYAREQRNQLVADRHPCATVALDCVRKAFSDGAQEVSARILGGQSTPRMNGRIRLTENLLARPSEKVGQ